jgi:hypothetical protein
MNPVRTVQIGACLLALALSWQVLTGAQKTSSNGLQFAAGPPDGLRLALAAAEGRPNAERRDVLQVGHPLPLYTLESDALAAGKGLETARACGFQYLIESSETRFVGSVNIHLDSNCASRMTALGNRDFGSSINRALLALAADERVQAGSYEPRMIYADLNLAMPAARHLVAVWLKSLRKGGDLIYPLEQPPVVQTDTVYTTTEVLKRLRPQFANVQWSSDYDLHAYFVDRFLESPGNGISRVYQAPMSIRDSMRLRITSRDTYRLESFDLIGVGKHPDPVAFLGRRHQTVSLNRQTRALTAFEERAVAELKAGEDVAVEANETGRFVVGALRAQEDCLKCHGGKTGDVLGALSYRLTSAEPMNSSIALITPR